MRAPIVAEQLQFPDTLIQGQACQGRAICERHARPLRSRARAWTKRSEERDQICALGFRQIRERRHARAGQSLANHRFEIGVSAQWNTRDDGRTEFATATFCSVARRTAAGEDTSAGLDALCVHSGRTANDYQQERTCKGNQTHETS
jgi:hypothetical protein